MTIRLKIIVVQQGMVLLLGSRGAYGGHCCLPVIELPEGELDPAYLTEQAQDWVRQNVGLNTVVDAVAGFESKCPIVALSTDSDSPPRDQCHLSLVRAFPQEAANLLGTEKDRRLLLQLILP